MTPLRHRSTVRVDEAVARLGGVTTHKALTRLVSGRALQHAVEDGVIVRDGLGRYSLRAAGDAVHAAHALTGTVSHLSAAQHWGWELKSVPPIPHVTVPRKRNVAPARRLAAQVHWADLRPSDILHPGVTGPARTLLDCLTTVPFDAGLAVADSALRHGSVTQDELRNITSTSGGRGSATARRVAAHADGRAANPFESVLRAIALDVPRLCVVPSSRSASTAPTWSTSRSASLSRLIRTPGTALGPRCAVTASATTH